MTKAGFFITAAFFCTNMALAATPQNAAPIVDQFPFTDNDGAYVMLPKYVYNESGQNFNFQIYEKVNLKDMQIPPCDELPILIEKCSPSVCMNKTDYGTVYRKIIEFDASKKLCRYAERTTNLGGIDCKLPFTSATIDIMHKYISLFGKHPHAFTEAEQKDLIELKRANCSVTPEERFTHKVTVQTMMLTADDAIQNFLQDVLKNNIQAIPDAGKKSNNAAIKILPNYDGHSWNIPTITFYPEESTAIQEALNRLQPRTADGDKLAGSIASFYVNSIIYISPEKWTVWVNNARLSSDAPNNYISVQNISPEEVTFKWVTVNLDKIVPHWKSFVVDLGDNRYRSVNEKIRILIKDETIAELEFDLSLNQTFAVNSMTVIEGKVKKSI